MAALFRLEIYAPNRRFFTADVEAVSLVLEDGEATVLANHAPFTAPVVPCVLKIKDKDANWSAAFTAEGILEVTSRKTVLMSDAIERPEEIDRERAARAKEKAEAVLKNSTLKFELVNAAMSLRRAEYRLKVSESIGK